MSVLRVTLVCAFSTEEPTVENLWFRLPFSLRSLIPEALSHGDEDRLRTYVQH